MSGYAIPCQCSSIEPHQPHFYISAIAGGPPGPIPTVGCVCPGRSKEDA